MKDRLYTPPRPHSNHAGMQRKVTRKPPNFARRTHARTYGQRGAPPQELRQSPAAGLRIRRQYHSEHFAHITHPSRASSSPTSRRHRQSVRDLLSCYNCYRTHTCGTRARSPTSVVTTLRLKILFIAHRIYGTTFEFPHPHPRRHRSWHQHAGREQSCLHRFMFLHLISRDKA